MSQARGGHPEQHEAGGGWGAPQSQSEPQSRSQSRSQPQPQPSSSSQRFGDWPRTPAGGDRKAGPRPEFVQAFEAFEGFDAFGPAQTQAARRASPSDPSGPSDPYGPVVDADGADGTDGADDADGEPKRGGRASEDEPGPPEKEPAKGGKGRAFTGIAAAAVITVLGVVVAGQVVSDSRDKPSAQTADRDRGAAKSPASRSNARLVPPTAGAPAAPAPAAPAAPVTYAKLMAAQFPLDPELTASGNFAAVPGFEKAPGKGRKVRYRVDVEKGLGLDAALFAKAVQETLNDDRSWAHGGTMSFERISSGEPEFVITLASPGTTATWCAKSGLDTTVDNVSCDSASTDRVMINAFRWARGAETYGPKAMLTYRQMLINHEVGHRLGHGHVSCSTPGALAPVMQQQTKSLDVEGIKCRANPWVYPTG
jgi:hypothetical protein